MLEKVIVSWWEGRWIQQMRQNFVAEFVQLLKYWLCEERLDFVMEKNWALSVDQCQLQALHFSVHLISLLNILLRYDNTKIQKVAVDQAGSRPPNSDHDLIWCKFDFGKCFGASWSNRWAGCHWLLYRIHFLLHVTIRSRNSSLFLDRMREDNTSKWWFFFLDLQSACEALTYLTFLPFQFTSTAEQP